MNMQDSDFTLLEGIPTPSEVRNRRPSRRHPASRRGRVRNGQAFLNGFRARCTRVTVMRPEIKTQNQRSWTMHDYITVPRVELHGTWGFGDMLSDDSIGNLLRAYAEIKGR